MEWAYGFLVLLVIGYIGLCVFYALFQEKFIFIRFRTAKDHVYKFRSPYEERFLSTPDGAELHALYFKAQDPRGAVLYYHGNTGSLRRWGNNAHRFVRMGYDVLMPDPRGYGKSRGDLSEAALHADAEAWYLHLAQQWSGSEIVLYGRSLGSGLATPVAAQHATKALILETPFANLYEVAMNYLPILPYKLLLRYPFRNDIAMEGVRCPVYVLHGKRDNLVPFDSALRLYSLIPSNVHREMLTFPKGNHSNLDRFPRYHKLIKKVLDG